MTCARCKAWPAVIGSRCMRCRVRECARECGLNKYAWWRKVEEDFIGAMLGRFLNDGQGLVPPTVEETLRLLRVYSWVMRYRRLGEVTALVEMVDRARRKNARPNRG